MHIVEAIVLKHVDYFGGYRLLVLDARDIAEEALPGQFIHLRVSTLREEALRRPFSIYRTTDTTVSIMYKPVGRGSRALVEVEEGSKISTIGPLGNGYPPCVGGAFPVLVAGGYGVAPFNFFAIRSLIKGTVFIGAKTSIDLLCITDFEKLGWEVCTSTEDGSQGHYGIITEALDFWLEKHQVIECISQIKVSGCTYELEFYSCGPDGLLRAIGDRAAIRKCRSWISLDRPMGCGIGACLTCVQKIRESNGGVTWARCCCDGPIFEGKSIVWDEHDVSST